MPGAKEIRSKIRSIKNTQKITRAMEMVAASKMRKAQDVMFSSRPYAEHIRKVIDHLKKSHPEYRHPYLQSRETKRVGLIVVTTDRGLCGGLNANLLKTTVSAMKQWSEKDVAIDLCLIGNKADLFFKRFGGHVVGKVNHLGDKPSLMDLIGVVKVMLDGFDTGVLDAVFMFSNEFVNTVSQRPLIAQLLPIVSEEPKTLENYWDYIYEPDAKELLDLLLTRFIESQVYQKVVENIACEQAARMVAMKNASDNAGELIQDLALAYNKARQAAITQELSEIISGATVVE
jgi:F-type H+-transporting ATPase subunit gamma